MFFSKSKTALVAGALLIFSLFLPVNSATGQHSPIECAYIDNVKVEGMTIPVDMTFVAVENGQSFFPLDGSPQDFGYNECTEVNIGVTGNVYGARDANCVDLSLLRVNGVGTNFNVRVSEGADGNPVLENLYYETLDLSQLTSIPSNPDTVTISATVMETFDGCAYVNSELSTTGGESPASQPAVQVSTEHTNQTPAVQSSASQQTPSSLPNTGIGASAAVSISSMVTVVGTALHRRFGK